jgi:agmatine deiminase
MSPADRPQDEGRQTITPASQGFRMPAEWEPHERCVLGWPTEIRIGSVWGEQYLLAMASYAAVAHAIAAFEPVLMLARPGEGGTARSYCGDDIEVVEMPIDDSWLRDSGPIFVTRPDGTLAMSDFTFNSWGEKYLPYDNDAAIGKRLAEHFGVERFAAPMVLEGGGITVDGEGTLITTESCLLHPSRNPGLTKDEMTQVLKDYLGVEKVIWLISGLGLDEDPDTDGHVDGVGAFVAPGRVLLHMVRDPQHADFENLQENRRRLQTTDARGREIDVVEFDARSRPVLVGDTPIIETYINSYFADGALIVPTSGTGDDEAALDALGQVVPGRKVVGVPCPVVGYGGGGIHCITQQVPLAGPSQA